MRQTANTAIVLRYVNYRDHDRMLTLFSPTKGRLEAVARGCRRPRSPLLSASELFALGEFDLYEKNDRLTVVSAALTETFYPLRRDFDRLACGTYLLELAQAAIQPNEPAQELFMLLLHTLSRLTFSEQEWMPLLSGFLLHYAVCVGFRPQLTHCVACGAPLGDNEQLYFDVAGGGLCCHACREKHPAVAAAQVRWMRQMLMVGSSGWVNQPDCYAPFSLLRQFVESRLDKPIHSAKMLPLVSQGAPDIG